MILKKAIISNYRGINGPVEVKFNSFNCIVGQNDAGKSTILRAIDASLNETTLTRSDYNVLATDNQISVELYFHCNNMQIALGEEILTTIEAEELTNQDGLLVWKKTWVVTETAIGKPKTSIVRKKYVENNDFIFKTEAQLINLCNTPAIETSKGNGEEYNNVEKREKLRAFYVKGIAFSYEIEDLPATGNTKSKIMGDAIKKALPIFHLQVFLS